MILRRTGKIQYNTAANRNVKRNEKKVIQVEENSKNKNNKAKGVTKVNDPSNGGKIGSPVIKKNSDKRNHQTSELKYKLRPRESKDVVRNSLNKSLKVVKTVKNGPLTSCKIDSPVIKKNSDKINHQTSELKYKLRPRESKDVVRNSLNKSLKVVKSINKIPVYKQPIIDAKPTSEVEDLYEFDSDSEAVKKKRRQRRKKLKTKPNPGQYDKKMRAIVTNIVKKIIKDKKDNINVPVVILEKLSQDIMTKLSSGKNRMESFDAAQPINDVVEDISENINENPEEILSDDDLFFGFTEQSQEKPKIVILSDILLNESKEILSNNNNNNFSIDTPAKFKRPNANSTMINNRILTPWRFNEINVKRNPHFLNVKRSALPNINQEIILDHTHVDKFNDTLMKTPKRIDEFNNKKTPVQKSLLNYIKSNNNNFDDKENIIHTSNLFDDNDFSPIKNSNLSNNKNNKIDSVKRNILKPKEFDDNNIIIQSKHSTPLQPNDRKENSQSNKEIITNFGFDSTDNDKENISDNGQIEEKPFRVLPNLIRKYQNNKKKTNETQLVEEEEEEEEEELFDNSDSEDELSAENNDEQLKKVGIFIDLENKTDEFKPLPRKRKLKWFNDENKSKKKAKDILTKAEEMALNKWADSFNSMCEEIEKHTLEIE